MILLVQYTLSRLLGDSGAVHYSRSSKKFIKSDAYHLPPLTPPHPHLRQRFSWNSFVTVYYRWHGLSNIFYAQPLGINLYILLTSAGRAQARAKIWRISSPSRELVNSRASASLSNSVTNQLKNLHNFQFSNFFSILKIINFQFFLCFYEPLVLNNILYPCLMLCLTSIMSFSISFLTSSSACRFSLLGSPTSILTNDQIVWRIADKRCTCIQNISSIRLCMYERMKRKNNIIVIAVFVT